MAAPARGEGERIDIFDFLLIDEPRDRRYLAGKDFYDGGDGDRMDAEEEVALTPGDEKGADVPAITDADIEHNPFPRVKPAAASKKRNAN